jgi:hypothetical protein
MQSVIPPRAPMRESLNQLLLRNKERKYMKPVEDPSKERKYIRSVERSIKSENIFDR